MALESLVIEAEFVPLYVALKLAGWVGSGGEAKYLVSQGEVTLNGEVELQKRKKLHDQDVIGLGEQRLKIEAM